MFISLAKNNIYHKNILQAKQKKKLRLLKITTYTNKQIQTLLYTYTDTNK